MFLHPPVSQPTTIQPQLAHMIFLVLFVGLANCLFLTQKPLHKISVKTHEESLVSSMLYAFYTDAYNRNAKPSSSYIANYNSIALQYTSDPYCVESSSIRYFIKSFTLGHNEYPASMCNLNLNNRFVSVVTPFPEFHETVRGTLDQIPAELLSLSRAYIEDLPDFSFQFYDFQNLNYDLECNNRYFELMQVMYLESVLEVNLQVLVTVPSKCSFKLLNADFDTIFDKGSTEVQIPVSGEFFCQAGKTPYCKKDNALKKNLNVRLFE